MSVPRSPSTATAYFSEAVDGLRSAPVRPEVVLQEVPAPRKVAPYAYAVDGHVELVDLDRGRRTDSAHTEADDDVDEAGGRLVLLHDPDAPEPWGGDLRLIALLKAVVEPELAEDPMLADVVWSWLEESLEPPRAVARRIGGTVTRVVSESYGTLSDRPRAIQVELRASWTPEGSLAEHLQSWADLMCRLAGLPPLPAGVRAMPRRR